MPKEDLFRFKCAREVLVAVGFVCFILACVLYFVLPVITLSYVPLHDGAKDVSMIFVFMRLWHRSK